MTFWLFVGWCVLMAAAFVGGLWLAFRLIVAFCQLTAWPEKEHMARADELIEEVTSGD